MSPMLPLWSTSSPRPWVYWKGKEDRIYIAPLSTHAYSQSTQTWIIQFYMQITPCLPFLRKRSPDGAITTEAADIQLQLSLLLIYRPQKDERLSWPGWLTHSEWFTHISSHPSATGRVQDKESSPAKDRRYTVVPRDQHDKYGLGSGHNRIQCRLRLEIT